MIRVAKAVEGTAAGAGSAVADFRRIEGMIMRAPEGSADGTREGIKS